MAIKHLTGRIGRSLAGAALILTAALTLGAPKAQAQIGSDRYSALVMDAATGRILEADSPDAQRHPASLTKLMTLYLTFSNLRDGRLSLGSPIQVSYECSMMAPSKLGLAPGAVITVEEAILAIVTKSANDVACSLGEAMGGGSQDRFAQMMTLQAHALGMSRTNFANASGLPNPDNYSTARDMALLARHIILDFPNRYAYFSTPAFNWRGRVIMSHNHMLTEYPGADGLKTGFINASGFNLVTSAKRDGVRLIGVIFGGSTWRERDRHMMMMLDTGFSEMGVAPMDRGGTVMASRMPSVMGTAHAATLARARPVYTRQVAKAKQRHAPRYAANGRARVVPVRLEQGDAGGRERVVRAPRAQPAAARRAAPHTAKPRAKVLRQAEHARTEKKPAVRTAKAAKPAAAPRREAARHTAPRARTAQAAKRSPAAAREAARRQPKATRQASSSAKSDRDS